MKNPVIHWEIGGHEGEKLAWFYGELFGWSPQAAGEGYWLVQPQPPGIGGAACSRPRNPSRRT
jgi:predicted enzyme related to lactoylglutathione lyase